MHFMSRIQLAVDAARAAPFWRAFSGDGYAMHQAVWDLFSRGPDDRRSFLYRIDQEGRKTLIYAVSKEKPQADGEAGRLWKVETKPYEVSLREGDRLVFQLRANATVTRNDKRHDVVMDLKHRLGAERRARSEAEIVQQAGQEWIEARAAAHGFRVIGAISEAYRVHNLRKGAQRGARMRFATVDLHGLLEVTEPSLFMPMLFSGLGRARAFGCGLMLVRRA